MQNEVDTCTMKKDLVVKRGNFCFGQPERVEALGSFKHIKEDMDDICKSFVRLGYHLFEMQRYRYYEDFGFQTLEDFAAANLGMDKSNVYRYIRVYEKFADKPETDYDSGLASTPSKLSLSDEYKDFSFSQLVEMSSMSIDQQRVCTPDMTIKQLREIKKAVGEYTTFEQAQEIALLVSGGVTAAEIKDETQIGVVIYPEKPVATSPQKDRSKEFSFGYYIGLHGAARAAYLKSRKAIDGAEILVYDSEGKRLKLEPLALNQPLDLLYCKDGNYIFRLKSSLDQPDKDSQ